MALKGLYRITHHRKFNININHIDGTKVLTLSLISKSNISWKKKTGASPPFFHYYYLVYSCLFFLFKSNLYVSTTSQVLLFLLSFLHPVIIHSPPVSMAAALFKKAWYAELLPARNLGALLIPCQTIEDTWSGQEILSIESGSNLMQWGGFVSNFQARAYL